VSNPVGGPSPRGSGPATGNPFGLAEAAIGLVAGFLLSILAVTAYAGIDHIPARTTTYGSDMVSLAALWVGFVGACFVATRLHAPRGGVGEGGVGEGGSRALAANTVPTGTGTLAGDFGIRLQPWPDLPLGVAVGVGAQFLLVPLLEAPLSPFVPHLSQKLGHPTTQLLGNASGAALVVLAVLVCVGSPLVEELFFRGLVLRSLLGKLSPLGRLLGPAASVLVTGLVFGLVHFEALQFLGLAGFGVVLSYLAYRMGRLGPSIVAHVAFNSTTVIFYVYFQH
jgi:membrane protease YdiL (CAAX protease family)